MSFFYNQKFVETPIIPIDIEYFSHVWVKDESRNPTGTHKDRLATSIIKVLSFLFDGKQNNIEKQYLPRFSLISTGPAAIAFQNILYANKLPNLKVIVDSNTCKRKINLLNSSGCEVFQYNLNNSRLDPSDVLSITNNSNGIDLTPIISSNFVINAYESLCSDILNLNPDFIFTPFGTGNLFESIIHAIKKKMISNSSHLDKNILKRIHVIGAKTNKQFSKANGLFSSYLPYCTISKERVSLLVDLKICGKLSGIYNIDEPTLEKAIEISKSHELICDPEGIVGLAIMLKLKHRIPKESKIVIINTGSVKIPTFNNN